MVKVQDETKTSYKTDSVSKSIEIRIPSASIVLHNEDILSQSISLNESIETSTNLSFQGCIASCLKFKCADIVADLEGMWIEADMTADSVDEEVDPETIPLFRGYINDQSNPSHEQNTMEIIAYDALKRINEADVTSWYNSLGNTFTIKSLRDSFFSHLGITQVEDYLPNDGITVKKTLTDKTITGSKIIKAICQINGRFGRISRTGKFEYVHLVEGTEALYPREDLYPADDIYPSAENAVDSINKAHYISVSFENYTVSPINKVSLVGKDGTIVANAGSGSNVFYLKDNFLLWELASSTLSSMARNLYNSIQGLWYTPASVNCPGLPYIECGDFILLATKRSIVRAYVLNRTLTGVQALRDTFDAKGDKKQPKYIPTVQTQITANTQAIATETSDRITAVSNEASARTTAITNEANARKTGDTNTLKSAKIYAEEVSTDTLRAANVYADKVTTNTLNAATVYADRVVADKVTVKQVRAEIGTYGFITAKQVEANYASIGSLSVVEGKIDTLSSKAITTDYLSSHWVETYGVRATNGFQFRGVYLDWVEFDGHRLIGVR